MHLDPKCFTKLAREKHCHILHYTHARMLSSASEVRLLDYLYSLYCLSSSHQAKILPANLFCAPHASAFSPLQRVAERPRTSDGPCAKEKKHGV